MNTCYICLEDIIKSENINCTTCNCMGSIGHVHDKCLYTFSLKQTKEYRLIDGNPQRSFYNQKFTKCGICNSEFKLSNQLKVLNKLSNNINPNIIRRDYLNNEITEQDIEMAKRFVKKHKKHKLIYDIIIISIIICLFLYFNNWFTNTLPIYFFFINCIDRIYLCNFVNFITLKSVRFIELFTLLSVDYINLILFIIGSTYYISVFCFSLVIYYIIKK
uniref:RING-CH-type domain-containing protein n=1 Tax=viral metagenome TaxID=1070528 RepID=A0A6C0AFG3_9ZZZZ